MNVSHDKLITNLNLMSEAIPEHLEILRTIGMTEESAAKLKEFKTNLEKIDSEQEKLKTDLKLKTEELNKTKKEALELYSEYRKLVKIKIDQKSWKAFGIGDKQ